MRAVPSPSTMAVSLATHQLVGGSVRNTTRVAALSSIVFALASIAWFALELIPPSLGFEDTDNPAVMLRFVRAHPDVYVQAGIALILMAITLTVATLAVADVAAPRSDSLAVRCVSAFGLIAAAFYLLSGALRIGASGPLLHFASLKDEWGEAAYLAVQVASQGLLISGIVALCLWAVGLSLIGLRTKVIPVALCALGIFPAIRLVTGLLGPLGALPDSDLLWVLSITSIPGVMLWCLLLGIVLLRRGFGSAEDPHVDRAPVVA